MIFIFGRLHTDYDDDDEERVTTDDSVVPIGLKMHWNHKLKIQFKEAMEVTTIVNSSAVNHSVQHRKSIKYLVKRR